MKKLSFVSFLAALFLFLFVGTGFSAVNYTVKSGDSLYLISRNYQLTSQVLKDANGLKSDMILPGQKLVIPALERYMVRSGDSLYRIAQARATSTASLINLNHLKSSVIYPGQVLLAPERISSSNTQSVSRSGLGTSDAYLLAQLINAEACGEPFEGQVAVGAVVLNRLKDARFPKTIKDIIFQYCKGIPQFEPVTNGQIYQSPSQTALRAAYAALSGWDPSYGALYFYNPQKSNSSFFQRVLSFITRIGNHFFYK